MFHWLETKSDNIVFKIGIMNLRTNSRKIFLTNFMLSAKKIRKSNNIKTTVRNVDSVNFGDK